jgi:O-antigen/teichoic acid export membrane protein
MAKTINELRNERNSRARLALAGSVLARLSTMGANFLVVPLTLSYLGQERYGVWVTITTLNGLLAFADLGLGNGLINAIAQANGRDDQKDAASAVSSAFFALCGVAMLAIALLFTIVRLVDLRPIVGVSDPVFAQETINAALAYLVCFFISLPASVVSKVQVGYQEGFAASLWTAAGTVSGLLSVVMMTKFNVGLVTLVVALCGVPILVSLLNSILVFALRKPWLCPSVINVKHGRLKELFGTGLLFFMMQVIGTLSLQCDNLLIARYLGAVEVTRFSVAFRLFTLVSQVALMATAQLWPAYGEAFARRDHAWIQASIRKNILRTSLMVVPGCVFLATLGNWIVGLWTGGLVQVPQALLVALAFSTIVTTLAHPLGIFLLSTNHLRFAAIATLLLAPTAVVSKMLLLPEFGAVGLVWGSAVPYLIINTAPQFVYCRRLLLKLKNEWVPA